MTPDCDDPRIVTSVATVGITPASSEFLTHRSYTVKQPLKPELYSPGAVVILLHGLPLWKMMSPLGEWCMTSIHAELSNDSPTSHPRTFFSQNPMQFEVILPTRKTQTAKKWLLRPLDFCYCLDSVRFLLHGPSSNLRPQSTLFSRFQVNFLVEKAKDQTSC